MRSVFSRRSTTKPVSAAITDGKDMAHTLAPCANLPIFFISYSTPPSADGGPAVIHHQLPTDRDDIIAQDIEGTIITLELEVTVIGSEPSVEHGSTTLITWPSKEKRRGVCSPRCPA